MVGPTVWTERMLTALDTGVKGGKWYSLMDKICAMPNLQAAYRRVEANDGAAGVDRQTIEMFAKHLVANLEKIAEELKAGTYEPKPGRPRSSMPPNEGGSTFWDTTSSADIVGRARTAVTR